ncbi:MAG: hypothetical protein J6U42_02860, partial [Lachnospiraceae bacterium]|nr:hypothetical protein [Lachnospiraceae bacterium]
MIFSKELIVPKSGKYGLSVKYSNAGGKESPVELSVNGVKETLILSPTVNRATFTEFLLSFVLSEGKNLVKIKAPDSKTSDQKDGPICISSVKVFDIYETCDAIFTGSMTKEQYFGKLPCFTHDGDGLKFKVFTERSGKYALRIRYGAGNTNSEPQSITWT